MGTFWRKETLEDFSIFNLFRIVSKQFSAQRQEFLGRILTIAFYVSIRNFFTKNIPWEKMYIFMTFRIMKKKNPLFVKSNKQFRSFVKTAIYVFKPSIWWIKRFFSLFLQVFEIFFGLWPKIFPFPLNFFSGGDVKIAF